LRLIGMTNYWIIFGIVVVVLAWVSAMYHKRRGYFFWRTFILAIMGFGGLGLFILKLLIS
jgi:hypothetical protein